MTAGGMVTRLTEIVIAAQKIRPTAAMVEIVAAEMGAVAEGIDKLHHLTRDPWKLLSYCPS